MTKMIKMSLMAAVAVAGTTASAQSLEDAIKNVDVSGYVDYRLENKSVEGSDAKSFNVNEYAVNVTLTSKVNDIVKATVAVGFDEKTTDNGTAGDEIVLTASQDADPSMNVSNAYFTFNLGGTTVMAGKQAIPSAFVDKVDTAKTGTGIVALHKVNDALTLAGAHFMNNNIATTDAVTTTGGVYGLKIVDAEDTKTTELIAMGKIEMVNYAVHYNMTDISGLAGGTEANHLFVKVGAAVAGVNLELKHATASADTNVAATTFADSSVTQLKASTKVSDVTLSAAYATADKEKGSDDYSSDVALDGDNDAEVHLKVWQLSTVSITNKGNAMMIGAAMPVMDNLTASLTYASATNDATTAVGATDTDYKEILAQLTYKMSKNFTVHGRYSTMNTDTNKVNGSTDSDYSRLSVKYTF